MINDFIPSDSPGITTYLCYSPMVESRLHAREHKAHSAASAAEQHADAFYVDNPEPDYFPLTVVVIDSAGKQCRFEVDLDFDPEFFAVPVEDENDEGEAAV